MPSERDKARRWWCRCIGLSALLVAIPTGPAAADQDEIRKAVMTMSFGGVAVKNSRVSLLLCSDLDSLVERGPKILPDLIDIMRDDKSSFATFVRCHCVCRGIVKKANPQRRILWYGGVRWKGDHFEPGGGVIDATSFRREVESDIVRAAEDEFGLRIDESSSP
jgi:hypothetical protein